ncbi:MULTISPECIES: hypothetical protein [unclassified Lysobacter]|uniref:hypothetical protein n=1 Tax=unclassified Lysobacter TaxID=2635362 RepID=UPI001BE5E694|nr:MULTISPECIES: hypothetical protein [unclassified Lysobacter]MBT2747151.1 hypothetical protein [Lysobacter sp. ISL-42]MBT2752957.1 hypothetical protein [Lysobacter sp. ISL-50]MBT2778882.1 hypothetical protein [Lysobacter sp. ISL-54]MBT2784224.1 hypothetical protein [Lysobacter sp. ISL-52]
MRSLLILMLAALSSTSCAKEVGECKQSHGEDKIIPAQVVKRLQSDLKDQKLIDRKECQDEVVWLAIPASQPVDKPRPVGIGRLVVFNKKTKEVLVVQGQ